MSRWQPKQSGWNSDSGAFLCLVLPAHRKCLLMHQPERGLPSSSFPVMLLEHDYYDTLPYNLLKSQWSWASLVAQWLRTRLPMQGTRVRALVREDSTCHGATKPVHHNYWACALEPASHNYWAHVPQLLKPKCLEPVLRNKRSHRNEKPMSHNKE